MRPSIGRAQAARFPRARLLRRATSLLLAAFGACDDSTGPSAPSAVLAVAVDTTAMPLVRRVTVVLREPGPAWVTWRAPGAPTLRLAADSNAYVHQFLVTRLRQGREYTVEAAAPGGAGAPVRRTFTTDSLPPALRALRINRTGTPSLPVALIEIAGAAQVGGLLMVEGGEVVGWLPLVGSLFGSTRRANGDIVLMDGALGLTVHRLDGTLVHRLPHPGPGVAAPYGRMHHEVIATPQHTLLFIANETQVVGADTVTGEAIWEWAPESGIVVQRWSAFDHLDWTQLRGSRSSTGNWLHGNGLSLGPRGNILMSLRNADQVISIAPDWQSVEWSLGGTTGTLAVAAADRPLGQHYVSEPAPGRVLVFDNGYERPGGAYSRAIEYQVDPVAGTATKVWEYRESPDNYAALVGSARRLPNGNTTILFGMLQGHNGSSGPITAVEVTPAGTPVWRLTFGPQLTRLYRLTPVASLAGEIELLPLD